MNHGAAEGCQLKRFPMCLSRKEKLVIANCSVTDLTAADRRVPGVAQTLHISEKARMPATAD